MAVHEDTEVDLAATREYVEDVVFPTTKDDIVQFAEKNGAPEDVLRALRQIADIDYTTPEDLDTALMELY